jgi:hypothetical protein
MPIPKPLKMIFTSGGMCEKTKADAALAVTASDAEACAHPHMLHSGLPLLLGYLPPITASNFTFFLTKSTPAKGLCSSATDLNSASRFVNSPMDDMTTDWSGWEDKTLRYT